MIIRGTAAHKNHGEDLVITTLLIVNTSLNDLLTITAIIAHALAKVCCTYIGKVLSSISWSLEKRDKNLPTGVVSKNHFGDLRIRLKLAEKILFPITKRIKLETKVLQTS